MNSLKVQTKIKIALYIPFLLLHLLLFELSSNKDLIISDVIAWKKYRDYVDCNRIYVSLIKLLVLQPEFRTQFTLRLGRLAHFLPYLKGINCCDLGRCKNIGKGFVLMHGFGTVFNGASIIGNNCTVLHSVTIGGGRGGAPTIGNNVYIGAGAIVVGGTRR